MPCFEVTVVVLVHSNTLKNNYQQSSRFLHIFAPNKQFGQLLDISPKNFMFSKAFDSEFSCIEVWFTNQNSKQLEREDKENIALVFNLKCKLLRITTHSLQPTYRTFVKAINSQKLW